VLGGTF